ncbi:MAG: efflux RND transporter periplasmic adaptor subunit [Elusimicrobiota bacterium]
MKKIILSLTLVFLLISACSKNSSYNLRPAEKAEIGMQAVCPVTNNVFTVEKETMAVDYKGKTYFLCCPDCSADFEKKLGVMTSHDMQNMKDTKDTGNMKDMKDMSAGTDDKEIVYWTCPMHPQVKEHDPGQCPICSMDLVPVYKKEGNKIAVDQKTGKLLGLKSSSVRVMRVDKSFRLPARVAYDNDLYLTQQEYILTYKSLREQGETTSDLLDATKFRLTLFGYTDKDIKALEKRKQPDKTLLFPGSEAWLFADVYENDLQSVKPGRNVTVVTDTYPSVRFYGKVVLVEPSLNPETRSAKARIIVDNTRNLLKLEMFANVEIKISGGNLIAVPKTALIDTGVRKVVYLDYGNGEYEPVDVRTGFAGDDYVEIKDGLKIGDRVVTNGNFMLDSESQLRSGGAGGGMDNMPGMEHE